MKTAQKILAGTRFETACMVFLVLGNAAFQLVRQDRIPINGGFGWDGLFYGELARNLDRLSPELAIYAQRILPSAIIYTLVKALSIPLSKPAIIAVFTGLNVTSLLLGLLGYRRVVRHLELSRITRWIGFLTLFFCFPSAKLAFYYPVLTDIHALAFGMWATCFFIEKDLKGMTVVLLLSLFTWPSLAAWMIPLMIFLRQPISGRSFTRLANICAMLTASGYLAGVYVSYALLGLKPYSNAQPVWDTGVLISAGVCALYLFFGFRPLIAAIRFERIMDVFKHLSLPGLAAVTGSIVVSRLVLAFVLKVPYVSPANFLFADQISIIIRSITLPGVFGVAHAVYFGPFVLALVLLWKEVVADASEWGYGYLTVLALTLTFSITSESRHLIHALPILLIPLLCSLERLRLEGALWPVFALGTLVVSKVWFKINPPVLYGTYIDFPFQRYFMHMGPWMNVRMYIFHGVVSLLFMAWMGVRIQTRGSGNLKQRPGSNGRP